MKKVLFVMHNLGYGGAERSLVNLLQELPKDRYEIDLLLFQKRGDFLQQLPREVRVLDTPEALNGLYAQFFYEQAQWYDTEKKEVMA